MPVNTTNFYPITFNELIASLEESGLNIGEEIQDQIAGAISANGTPELDSAEEYGSVYAIMTDVYKKAENDLKMLGAGKLFHDPNLDDESALVVDMDGFHKYFIAPVSGGLNGLKRSDVNGDKAEWISGRWHNVKKIVSDGRQLYILSRDWEGEMGILMYTECPSDHRLTSARPGGLGSTIHENEFQIQMRDIYYKDGKVFASLYDPVTRMRTEEVLSSEAGYYFD